MRIETVHYFCFNDESMLKTDQSLIDDFASRADIDGEKNNLFQVYPNPTSGRFTLELSEIASTVTIEIYGVMGEQILKQEVSGFMMYEFDLSTQPRGIYIVRVLNGDEMEIQRVIRQ
jgi:hypothetical protein